MCAKPALREALNLNGKIVTTKEIITDMFKSKWKDCYDKKDNY
jgi:hypothetical protein